MQKVTTSNNSCDQRNNGMSTHDRNCIIVPQDSNPWSRPKFKCDLWTSGSWMIIFFTNKPRQTRTTNKYDHVVVVVIVFMLLLQCKEL